MGLCPWHLGRFTIFCLTPFLLVRLPYSSCVPVLCGRNLKDDFYIRHMNDLLYTMVSVYRGLFFMRKRGDERRS